MRDKAEGGRDRGKTEAHRERARERGNGEDDIVVHCSRTDKH